ncbi:hypothetical protein FEM48_Zijuj10G0167500 [Ziziphus jujuba var. spinosa]|uniref:NB-ARC domain-containing protein n=1 Tax=Ziziphus jujuba var. spinosa TaxID=714518 RepID=A0A978UPJ3_ZIZJJ|nr:hypothetical protein FEM48_Zijuj10G0167500 [Ziziphus jujuba var. spinosa]
MESRMEKMDSLLDIELDDVRLIGIFGTQGIGKTTLAHQVFERVKHKFDAGYTAFIANVKRLYKKHFKIQGEAEAEF